MFKDYSIIPPRPGIADLICVDPAADPAAWPFEIVYSAVVLFEAMPEAFTFDALAETGERQGLSATRCAEHLRAYQRFGMVEIDGERICKTGQKPYF